MLAPFLNLVLLVLVNERATITLREAGLRVGLTDVKQDDIERVLNPARCSGCGYELTGNAWGICPECGREVERSDLLSM